MGHLDSARPFTLVTGVIREALRASGMRVAVVVGEGPEKELLVRWLEKATIPFETPLPSMIRRAEDFLHGLEGPGKDGVSAEEAVNRGAATLAGYGLAWARRGLQLGTANKTYLLLTSVEGGELCLPLGDLYASEILDLAGAATLPPVLVGRTEKTVRAVDEALEAYYGEGLGEEFAFRHLEQGVRDDVLAALSAARWRWQPRPLIPKLGKTTLGLDLDP